MYVPLNLILKNAMINYVTPTITFTSIAFLAHRTCSLLYMLYFKISCVYFCELSCVYFCSCLVCIVVTVHMVFCTCCILRYLVCIFVSCLVCIFVVVLCALLSSCVYLLYYVCTAVCNLDAGLLARSHYSESPAKGHLDTGFSCFPCVYKQMLRWFP